MWRKMIFYVKLNFKNKLFVNALQRILLFSNKTKKMHGVIKNSTPYNQLLISWLYGFILILFASHIVCEQINKGVMCMNVR